MEAKEQGNQTMVTRTISPFVHVYFGKTFSGKEGHFLFKDPERVSSWFKWDYKDLDVAYIRQKILSVVEKQIKN